jgi:hypothetical protein
VYLRMTNQNSIHRRLGTFCSWALMSGILTASPSLKAASTEFFAEPSWQPVEAAALNRQVDAYLRAASISDDQRRAAQDAWWNYPDRPGRDADLLERLARCLAKVDDRVATLAAHCAQSEPNVVLPDFGWLADSQLPELVRHNMRLYYARWLVQNDYDDEALAWTDGLSPADVVAPEALLFYRAVAEHRLVRADRADSMVAVLLERPDDLPLRYQKLAMLMQQDLAGLEDESLDHIARRMSDVRRRLELGRAGKNVQGVEQGVIDSLDKLIKKLEEQAQQQAQAGAAAGGQPSGSPMQDSRLAELKGPGKVEPRDVGQGADWGNLPDKDRERALQEIGRDFPSHYREVIEEYFRRLAAEPADDHP